MTEEYTIKEIIFAASQTSEEDIKQHLTTETKYHVVFSTTLSKCNAAENRNRGWERVSGNWIVFLDCDDIYHPDKLYAVHQAILRYPNIDCVVHSYLSGNQQFNDLSYKDPNTIFITPPEVVSELTPKDGVGNVYVPRKRSPTSPRHGGIHHAMATVRASSTIRYLTNIPGREDGRFCREQAWAKKLIVVDAKLMIYK